MYNIRWQAHATCHLWLSSRPVPIENGRLVTSENGPDLRATTRGLRAHTVWEGIGHTMLHGVALAAPTPPLLAFKILKGQTGCVPGTNTRVPVTYKFILFSHRARVPGTGHACPVRAIYNTFYRARTGHACPVPGMRARYQYARARYIQIYTNFAPGTRGRYQYARARIQCYMAWRWRRPPLSFWLLKF